MFRRDRSREGRKEEDPFKRQGLQRTPPDRTGEKKRGDQSPLDWNEINARDEMDIEVTHQTNKRTREDEGPEQEDDDKRPKKSTQEEQHMDDDNTENTESKKRMQKATNIALELQKFLIGENKNISARTRGIIMSYAEQLTEIMIEQELDIVRRNVVTKEAGLQRQEESRHKEVMKENSAWAAHKEDTVILIVEPAIERTGNSSENTYKEITKYVRPMEKNIQINRTWKTRNNGISIELPNLKQAAKLEDEIRKKQVAMKITKWEKRRPKVMIYGLPKEKEQDQIIEEIYEQNFGNMKREEFAEKFKILFTTRPGETTKNMVVEVKQDIWKMMERKGKIYCGWLACNIQEFLSPMRCGKCYRYGHTTKWCREKHEICGNCAKEGHQDKDCRERDSKCINCTRAKKQGNDINHKAVDKNCPILKIAKERLKKNIDYG